MIINLAKKIKLKTANTVCKEDITINPMLQTKTIKESGIVVPDAGYVGLGEVNVDVSISIFDNVDNPLFPKFGNIKFFEGEDGVVRYAPMIPFTTAYANDVSLEGGAKGVFSSILATLFSEKVHRGGSTLGERIMAVGAIWAKESAPITLEPKRFPACKLRAMIENVYSGEREIREKEIDEVIINGLNIQDTSSGDAGVFQMYSVPSMVDAVGERLIAAELVYPILE